jgi:outer membrane receptor protein involved in Fe transport
MFKPLARTLLAVAVALSTGHVYAESGPLEEVIVTAQKRGQNLQDTPIAVSAFGAAAITDQGIQDVSDVSQYIPNVEIVESPGGNTGATISFRGSVSINPAVTWEPPVGIYYALHGQADYYLTDDWTLTGGVRWTKEEKETYIERVDGTPGDDFGGTFARTKAKDDWTNISPMAVLSYAFSK